MKSNTASAIEQRAKLAAWKYFGYNSRNHKGLVLHHKDPTLKYTDPVRYHEWRPEDLEIMTRAEHLSLHNKGKVLSAETRKKISDKSKGNTRCKGYKHTDEARKNMSESHKGKTAWNKGLTKETSKGVAAISEKASIRQKGMTQPRELVEKRARSLHEAWVNGTVKQRTDYSQPNRKKHHWKLVDGKKVYY